MTPEEMVARVFEYCCPSADSLPIDTPARFVKAQTELLEGYSINPNLYISQGLFEAKYSKGMVVIRDIPVFSLCEHHLLPFYGTCDIGYIPREFILGLSKFSRVVNTYMRRIQVQERLTAQIANTLQDHGTFNPLGVVVVIRATHTCMVMRGAKAGNAFTTTSEVRGVFEGDEAARAEFFSLVGR